MRRRDFLYGGAAGALLPIRLPALLHALPVPPIRGVCVCVAKDAAASIREAAESIAHASGHPLLQAMGATPKLCDSWKMLDGEASDRAFNHLILVGLPSDPLIATAWQREAKPEDGGMYIFGIGHLRGDIGYIESDRNPFLHAAVIPKAPFETEVITITGSTPAGVLLAVNAFMNSSLINGVVASKGWSRSSPTLLDRDPLMPDFELPSIAQASIGDAVRIGYIQATEDEYRGVLADTGISPEEIWRVKYFEKGNWDGVGAEAAFDNYSAGLHRRAYGNTLWVARFDSSTEAAQAAPKIASAAGLKKVGNEWRGNQHPYANATYPGDPKVPGTLILQQNSMWVTMFAQQTRWIPGTPVGKDKVS